MNEIRGADLGVELHKLYQAAHQIADMADLYYAANAAVAETTGGPDGTAFANVVQGQAKTSTTGGSLGAAWSAMRDELLDLFAETQINLSDTADTLTAAVNSYAGEDDAAARRLAEVVANEREDGRTYDDANLPSLPPVNTGDEGPAVKPPPMQDDPVTSEESS